MYLSLFKWHPSMYSFRKLIPFYFPLPSVNLHTVAWLPNIFSLSVEPSQLLSSYFSMESDQLWLSCNISKLSTIVRNLPRSTFFRLSILLWHISWGGLTNISNLCGGWVALSFNALQGFSSQIHYTSVLRWAIFNWQYWKLLWPSLAFFGLWGLGWIF